VGGGVTLQKKIQTLKLKKGQFCNILAKYFFGFGDFSRVEKQL